MIEAPDNDKHTPLHLAARTNNEGIFRCLLKTGRQLSVSTSDKEGENDIYGITKPCNRLGQTPLFECAKYNRISFMEELLSTKDNSIKWKKTLDLLKDQNRMTCLHLACNHGKYETYL